MGIVFRITRRTTTVARRYGTEKASNLIRTYDASEGVTPHKSHMDL